MKKESYYTNENAAVKCAEWEKIRKEVKAHQPFQFNPKSAALLILDMQNFFLLKGSHAFVPSGLEIIPNIQLLYQYFSKHEFPIIFTRHESDSSPKDLMKKWWRDSILTEEKKSQIVPDFDTNSHQIIVKHQYSAFFNTQLNEVLQGKSITQLVITGVLTHLCCETTARDAFMHGYQVFFPYDATASYTETLHLGSIRAISHGFGVCLQTLSLLNQEK